MSKWESLQLNKIAGLVMGQSPSSDSYNTEGEGMPFFQGKSDFGKVNPKIRMYCKSPKKLAHKNDILLSVRAPVGDVNIAEGTCCIGRGLAAISGQKEKSYSKYIYYYLIWKKKELENIGVGSTFKAIGKKDIEKILIPLPPLDIQKKIATALDTANALIEKRKEQIEKLDLLIKSQFIEMFGDPVTNPKGWESLLWKCVFNTTTGKLDSNAMVTYGQYPFFTCAKESFLIDVYAFDCEALILAGNNAAGIYDVKYYSGKFNAYQRTYILTLKNAHNKYCIFKMQLELRLKQLRYNSKGTNTKYLTMEILNKLDFIIPPTDLQNQFAEFVQKVEAQKALLQKSLADMEQNYQSLLQKCFKGEIF